MDVNRILTAAAYAGKIMLQSGAEIYRVEDTMTRLCNAYHIKNVDIFASLTVVMVSTSTEYGQTISIIKRIRKRTLNLEKISDVNNISRNVKQQGYTLDTLEDMLKKIDTSKAYDLRTNTVFSGVVAAFFTLVFGGTYFDFTISFFIGCLIRIIANAMDSLNVNEFFINTFCGSVTALIALTAVSFSPIYHSDKIIIGSIMLLVPGLAITNAIRDTIAGDLISGISRGIEAFLVAAAIAVGTGMILKLWFVFGGVI